MNVSYNVEGPSAPLPIIFIHGFAEDGSIWDNQVAYLKQSHRLLIPDLPGSGKSALLTGPASMEELAGTIKAILDAESIIECIMIGHSMGGYIALAFAEKYPGSIKALALFHSTAYPDTEEKKTMRRKSIDFIRRNGPREFIRQSTPNLFAEKSRNKRPQLVSEMIDRYENFDPGSLVEYYEAMIRRPDRTVILQNFKGPVLLIIGEQDNVVPLEQSLRQAHMPALSFVYILENAGHAGMLEESELTSRIIDEFEKQVRLFSC
jgi:pimeloyl-ACP methyl ester carboxylesterase